MILFLLSLLLRCCSAQRPSILTVANLDDHYVEMQRFEPRGFLKCWELEEDVFIGEQSQSLQHAVAVAAACSCSRSRMQHAGICSTQSQSQSQSQHAVAVAVAAACRQSQSLQHACSYIFAYYCS